MENKEFDYDEIWNNVAKPEIDRMISLGSKAGLRIVLYNDEKESKKLLISRYISEKKKFKDNVMLNPNGLSDRHKIAALFYMAFVYRTDKREFPFMVFDEYYKRNLTADIVITHSVAYSISIGILESFALSDPKTPNYFKDYIKRNGMGEPKIICGGKINNDNYEKQTIKQFIYAQNKETLSAALLSNIFFLIDSNSRLTSQTQP